ncbi:hypothetical protein L1987_23419 [Smallanthus sonchifolius]|uniref:Uncharacterized protein n=1 Tax=Smallanthus sonchifolius TaxID=185202 RepID=A0ACB9IGV9_9ASTR|nr:hypothetical protein L1987_23419 [Smallanthus sonchifolius]
MEESTWREICVSLLNSEQEPSRTQPFIATLIQTPFLHITHPHNHFPAFIPSFLSLSLCFFYLLPTDLYQITVSLILIHHHTDSSRIRPARFCKVCGGVRLE